VREDRVHQALTWMPELERIKAQQGKRPESARGSTTDAAATVMKMGDGGFRPADNAQFATDTESQVIVGVEVVTVGTDDAQVIYRERAATAECVNAQARNRSLQQARPRPHASPKRARVPHALAHNLMRALALLPEVLGLGTATPDGVIMPDNSADAAIPPILLCYRPLSVKSERDETPQIISAQGKGHANVALQNRKVHRL
jgi:hypothetical protein